MPTPPVSREILQHTIDTWAACGRRRGEAAAKLGLSLPGLGHRLKMCEEQGIVPTVAPVRYRPAAQSHQPAPAPSGREPEIQAPPEDFGDAILAHLRRHSMTLDDIAGKLGTSRGQVLDAIDALMPRGVNITRRGDLYALDKTQAPAFTAGELPVYVSRPDNTFLFGAVSDTHLGSKYERMDVLNDLYDRMAARGVDRVFHGGNWIEGEGRAHFNLHDIHTHGMDAQLAYFVKHYPQRPGLTTYAVTGNDHEGWLAAREGIDIGRRLEQDMRDAGRDDWVNLGFMEAHIRLVNANTGAEAVMAVVHPGGGTAYALSYAVQKTIESLEGGEKPAVWMGGHYHKLFWANIRNVWCVQMGTTQDQTTFMRSKVKQEAHVGGFEFIRLEQDPETGAIVGFESKAVRYFNKGHYNHRWSYAGDVTLPDRRP